MSHPHSAAFLAARRRRRHLARMRRAERRWEARHREIHAEIARSDAMRAWLLGRTPEPRASRESERLISLRTFKLLLWGSWAALMAVYFALVWRMRRG